MNSGHVPSLKELGPLCQKPQYKTVGNWYVRRILRVAALPVTWLLLHTAITANQVTTLSLILGVWGIALLAGGSQASFLMGILLVQLWYFLDHVDGQIARFRKTSCLSGRFFDFITHHIIHTLIFFSLGFYVYQKTGTIFAILWGYVTSLSMVIFNLVNDTKYKTFFEALLKAKNFRVLDRVVQEIPEGQKTSLLRKIFPWIHKASEIHVLMNLLTVASLLEILFLSWVDFRLIFFIFYGLAIPLLAASKVIYLIKKRKIDAEYEAIFRIVE